MTAATSSTPGGSDSASEDSRVAGVIPPPEDRRAAVWDRPVPGSGRAPLFWLMSVHGGAGATTLARLIEPAADCWRRWPAVLNQESPYVVLVARETIPGLSRAHELLRQHHSGLAGPSTVLGLIITAARPGRVPPEIRRYREVVGVLAGNVWRLGWHEEWSLVEPEDLPVWSPGDTAPNRRRVDPLQAVPADIRELGDSILDVVREVVSNSSTGNQETEGQS